MHALGLWEELEYPWENPRRHADNKQTKPRKAKLDSNLGLLAETQQRTAEPRDLNTLCDEHVIELIFKHNLVNYLVDFKLV